MSRDEDDSLERGDEPLSIPTRSQWKETERLMARSRALTAEQQVLDRQFECDMTELKQRIRRLERA